MEHTRVTKPLPYTSNPLYLVWNDTKLFCRITFVWPITAGLLSIIWPFYPLRSGPLDELWPSWANLYAIGLHTFMVVAQLLFIASLIPSAFLGIPIPFYTPLYIATIALFVIANRWFSYLLNGKRKPFSAGARYAGNPKHEGEKWIFINGVAVGEHWLNTNLERLARTFRRPITGIHNQTRGIIFDVIECVIQRDFSFATLDIRFAYEEVVRVLSDDKVKKLVLILHSQGAIEGCLVLDWIYATLPNAQVSKLEVYTFGNAANHWNSPIVSQIDKDGKRRDMPTNEEQRVIKYIEHYANTGDFVSKFGILHFRPAATPTPTPPQVAVLNGEAPGRPLSRSQTMQEAEARNRFVGRLFKREGTGHQFNGNYLDNMFQMDSNGKVVLENNPFMDAQVDLHAFESSDVVEAKKVPDQDDQQTQVMLVKELSRLWQYRNGLCPKDWRPLSQAGRE